MKAMLSKHGTFAYHSRVNPRPVDWWGRPDDASYTLLLGLLPREGQPRDAS